MKTQVRSGIAWFAAGAILGPILPAQTPGAKPQFEVASVKPAAKAGANAVLFSRLRELRRDALPPGKIPMDDPGYIRLKDWAMVDLIAAAYRVRATQVVGPAWMSDQGFDLEAKVPEATPEEQLNAMLQSLLEERFGLKVHRGMEIRQGFGLTVGKGGPKLNAAATAPTPDQRQEFRAASQRRMEDMREEGTPLTGFSGLNMPSVTTEQLAINLAHFTEAPVVDQTGLTGKYSVRIETWNNPDVPGGSIFEAVEKLGLKLEARRLNVETVVVDEVSKVPTAN